MRYFFLAGEPSGDLHAGNLVRELKILDPQAAIYGWGGENMKAVGIDILTDLSQLSIMGFWEVVKKLPAIFRLFRKAKRDILTVQPDVVVLVDYPGFNLRLAKWLKKNGYKVAWYISPQLWAWKPGRIKTIKETVNLMMVILPFEEAYYDRFGIKAHYVGHPLVHTTQRSEDNPTPITDKIDIALLPGSRKQEIERILPIMYDVAKALSGETFLVAALSAHQHLYENIPAPPNVTIQYENTHDVLHTAKAAIVTSGTATLETALAGVPEVVVYKSSKISYSIAKRLIKVKYISLVNLIADKMIVPELIQQDCSSEKIIEQLTPLLVESPEKSNMLSAYSTLKEILGEKDAAKNAATLMYEYAKD